MKYLYTLFLEAFVVGILTIIFGTLISFIIGSLFSQNLPKICKEWNKNHIMEICLFFTGFFTHVIFELLGLNNWYCKHGRACQK